MFLKKQGLPNHTMFCRKKWLLFILLVLHLCYCFMLPVQLYARSTVLTQDHQLVTQEIRYNMPEAGEVFLIWGINGWNIVPEEIRQIGAEVKKLYAHQNIIKKDYLI